MRIGRIVESMSRDRKDHRECGEIRAGHRHRHSVFSASQTETHRVRYHYSSTGLVPAPLFFPG
jgi:hypothetical protein